MQPTAHAALTDELVASLRADERVLGLVLLGSTAEGADAFSDHDLFVVTTPGSQEAMRTDLGWLPPAAPPVLVLRETAHGLKIVLDDGHLIELAVFDLAELGVARVNRWRVAFDRGGVQERMEEVARASAAASAAASADPGWLFRQVVTCALVGATRHQRGETLSGTSLVKGLALRHLLELVTAVVPIHGEPVLDDLDPFRRFERAYPAMGRALAGLLRLEPDACALGLLAVAEQEVAHLRPDLPWGTVAIVRERIEQGGPSGASTLSR